MTEIDIDALLAGAGTVPEPSADLLLWQVARGGGREIDINQLPEDAFDTWFRYLRWRSEPGHRIVCPKCNAAFIREQKNVQLCVNCRRNWQRTCADCGKGFAAPHPAFRRCPRCREKRLKH